MEDPAMKEVEDYQKFLDRQYGWLLKLKGRKRYLLTSPFSIIFFYLLSVLGLFIPAPASTRSIAITTMIGTFGLLLSLIISLRLRYWRDIMVWGIVVSFTVMIMLFYAGFVLIFNDRQFFTLVFSSVLISFFITFRSSNREVEKWELARKKGLLKPFLDEENWVYDDTSPTRLSFYLSRATDGKADEKLRWLKRLEKLHYFIPGIMISFRRTFGHEELILSVVLIVLGLVFKYSLFGGIGTYLKILEWEKEKGKRILLRWVWEKEQQKAK
jgi:hypothetical protein